MFSRALNLSSCIRHYSRSAAAPKDKWHLMVGVLVERLQVISKELSPFERKYSDILSQVEFEQSMKSNHEIRHEKDVILAERMKRGDSELEVDDTLKQTAQDLEDAYSEEFKAFQLASRTTTADQKKDVLSLNRKLDESLMLVMEQAVGEKKFILFPQGQWNDGESLKDTADRILKEKCSHLDAQVLGNAPIGIYKYKYPTKSRQDAVGAKIFFYRAVLKNYNQKSEENCKWLSKEELSSQLNPDYCKSVMQFIV